MTPRGASSDLHPGHEVVEVGHLGQDVVADQQVGLLSPPDELRGGLPPEELDERRHALLDRNGRDVRRGLDAERGDAALHEVLEQVAVVARQLDDPARGRQAAALRSSGPCSARAWASQLSE